ncbi:type IX secretion system membrane protein PorP/SprF [Gaetbulibacter jejuensis]|uniref:Type IX secretion system membrane protein PorP/SprF n=1 Tax=Gaetbulibacter jejuensis TaxID=584607 RepID=A0ABP3UPS6_9FLAO
MKRQYNTLLKLDALSYGIGIVLLLILLCPSKSVAQQDSQYTQYMYNTSTINPAYAGTRGSLNFTGLYRTQWVGLDGAPETLNFTVSNAFNERVGAGLSFVQDKIGPSNESTITADFAYVLPMSDNGLKLSFGLKGGINLLDVDYTRLNIYNPGENVFQYNIDNRLTPIIGVGMYLYSDKGYFGVSVPNLLETTHYDDTTVSNATEKFNFYAIAGYVFNLSSNTKFKPAVLGKAVYGAPVAIDLSANFLFNEKFTLGAAYRLDAAVSALAGFQVSDQVFIGYAYDYDTTELGNYNSGSHEIFLRWEIFKGARPIVSPRFF